MDRPIPTVDVKAAAKECKDFLGKKKMDLVDYGFINIECYPPPTDEYPALKAFSTQWEQAFDYAESLVTDDSGTGFPHELILEFEAKVKEIEAEINNDADYWTELRAVIMPLYEKSEYYEAWQKRWKKVDLFYDPIGMEATTTEIFTNKKTGERIRGEIKRQTEYPAGFVIRLDGRFDE